MNADIEHLHTRESARVVRIPAGSVSLEGRLIVPTSACGLVLVAQGSGYSQSGPRGEFAAEPLRDSGLGTLRFDLLTTDEEITDAGEEHLRFNIGLLTQRLVCASHWVAGEDEARHLRLGFLGHGTGAAAALVAAADLGRSIGAVVSCGGRPDLAGNALRRVKSPTLLIVDERDEESVELNQEAFDMLDCEKELCVIPHATNSLQEVVVLEQAWRAAADWFCQHLQLTSRARFPR